MTVRVTLSAPDGIGEVGAGDDLAALVLAHCDLADGDVVIVTGKVVSKAEGRLRAGDRTASLPGETVRVVARRGPTVIVRNHLGLTMAAAGIDASNVAVGHHLLLPEDPDRSARRIREQVALRAGHNVAVLVTDTAGRAWRTGQTDICIGAAGLRVTEDLAGLTDPHGNPLVVTAPAVADEIAGAAELATGKLGGRPLSVLRGRPDLVLPAGEAGPGAAALVRGEGEDLFGLGAREAVVQALAGGAGHVFGAPAAAEDLAAALDRVLPGALLPSDGSDLRLQVTGPEAESRTALRMLAHAFGWLVSEDPRSADGAATLRLRPSTP
ncbi:coenzyme F420-0:L-glutamate ligase [Nocardioides donggukensis]|uniref:Coenzyme F420-0:L-glutamate ligase n=1 Tax=Nocardioides donggukensis TaxID=2774019 RepID=A0A927K356_9ACTN|nr:coenzyme F420-0:L-glutamate ligase [Nocardioides donggukensis]MBD8868728.1 coenzyme F420-0:L-glutamate ligase [Nocardioides donggukensis]